MDFLAELWLPILLSAFFVFLASSIIHMALPIHKGDYKKLPNEAKVLEAMRTLGVSPGHYMFPCPSSMKEMGSPDMMEKYRTGPVGVLTVMPNGTPNMGKHLTLWFLFSILISVFAAYVGSLGLSRGAEFMTVFRATATVAILGYGVSHFQDSIWKGLSWGVTSKFFLDGVIYGVVTGATFAWLWPKG